jgi:primase-polymerase (primpol)-like protein
MVLFNPENVENIPPEMREVAQWVCWVWGVSKKGKPTKEPICPAHPGRGAKTNDSTTWSDFETAYVLAQMHPEVYGLGFIFNQPATPFFGLDLDKVGQKGRFTLGEADAILAQYSETYAERSPSGTGYHVIGYGTVARAVKRDPGELYGFRRFFTVTGEKLGGHPSSVADIKPETLEWTIAQITRNAHAMAQEKHREYTPAPMPLDDYPTPHNRIDHLSGTNDGFHACWNRKKVSKYPSASEEDRPLCYMLRAGWSDQDILSAQRYWRVASPRT